MICLPGSNTWPLSRDDLDVQAALCSRSLDIRCLVTTMSKTCQSLHLASDKFLPDYHGVLYKREALVSVLSGQGKKGPDRDVEPHSFVSPHALEPAALTRMHNEPGTIFKAPYLLSQTVLPSNT